MIYIRGQGRGQPKRLLPHLLRRYRCLGERLCSDGPRLVQDFGVRRVRRMRSSTLGGKDGCVGAIVWVLLQNGIDHPRIYYHPPESHVQVRGNTPPSEFLVYPMMHGSEQNLEGQQAHDNQS
jgi:hypothetical protein